MTPPCGECWFAVLPDCDAALAVFRRLRGAACHVVPHESGRPWLVGCWSADRARIVGTGPVRVALLGVFGVSEAELRRRAAEVRATAQAEQLARGVAGSFHLLASVRGEVYARGAAAGARRLYRAAADEVAVLADRARTLAWLTGAEVDARQVAVRIALLEPTPFPLDRAAMFYGVRAVPPECAVRLDRRGRADERRWWHAPEGEQELPPAEAAAGLRQALRDAVEVRVRPGQVWAADLSGGMDSTSLCFLAAEAGARLVAATLVLSDAANEDAHYARLAVARLPSGTTHLPFPIAGLPPYLTGLADTEEPDDEPSLKRRDLAQQRHIRSALRAYGAERRLSGQGGDHVVLPPVAHLHDLVRRQPGTALGQLNAFAAMYRWPRGATARCLADRRGHAAWLADQSPHLAEGRSVPGAKPDLGWGPSMTPAPWATEQTRQAAAELLRRAAADVPPLAGTRGRHRWVHQAQQAGRVAVTYEQHGMALEMPFCDDAVLEACLRARPHEALDPWHYKPLLAQAMRGIVPDRLLDRTTKGDASAEWHAGMKARQPLLAAWADTSLLVAAGLADRDTLRRAWLSPGTLPAACGPAVETVLAAESWLRDIESHPTPDHLKEHPRDPDQAPDPVP
ncbi:asparagine synthase-related protein [Streptomyces sp. NRRL S-118]|uniref:asparagine synthase-related protein n=1 Tax=Streptomyces sp. NRRL S-118 TaxID=1463881 RepID=UPI000694E0D4|nr:asparagine synthase-related protein [Streptomyces sp. NRRL S-118]